MSNISIARVALAAVLPVRAAELRPVRSPKQTISRGDLLASSVHLAAISGDDIVGVASIVSESPPDPLQTSAGWRVRGVAVRDALRGTGIGRRLVAAACTMIPGENAVIWLYAQDRVGGFYSKLGFRLASRVSHEIAGAVGLYSRETSDRRLDGVNAIPDLRDVA